MPGDVVRRYAVTCGLLLVPIFVANVVLFERLPPAISDSKLWDAIPPPLALTENLLRFPIFALPFVMPLHVSTRQQQYGLACVVLGALIYLASWMALIVDPRSTWSISAAGFLAPAYTPALWLLGIALLSQDFSWGAPCRPWMYGSLSLAFLAAHVSHAAIVYVHHYGAAIAK